MCVKRDMSFHFLVSRIIQTHWPGVIIMILSQHYVTLATVMPVYITYVVLRVHDN